MGAAGTRVIFHSREGAERWGAIILEFREILEEELPEASVGRGCHAFMLCTPVGDYEALSPLCCWGHSQRQGEGAHGMET